MPLLPSHPIAEFRSGEPSLDQFLHRFALKNEGLISRTFVLLSENPELGGPPILGFYTLTTASVSPAEVTPFHSTKLPKYPQLGAVLIARLGRDERAKGLGVGDILLFDALRRCAELARIAGCVGVLVDAKHARAAQFYGGFGFQRLAPNDATPPHRMYLPSSTVLRVLEP